MYASAAVLALAFSAASGVSAHAVFVATTGATNGKIGQGFGTDPSTPRDGTKRNPFQVDTSIIRDSEVDSGDATKCGRTLQDGSNDIQKLLSAAESTGLPDIGPDGTVKMTVHQINADGAGPYQCEFNKDATGDTFAAMDVITNVPGTNSRSRAKATDFDLIAKLPAGVNCTGGTDGQTCIVRCRNNARAGPFGACCPFTQKSGSGAGKNTTAATDAGKNSTSKRNKVEIDTAGGDTEKRDLEEAEEGDLVSRRR